MTDRRLACVVLAAGKGTRMKSDLPKVLHPLAGVPMVRHVVDAAASLGPERIVVVVGPGMDSVAAAVAPHPTVVQQRQQGTADALAAALPLLEGFDGDVLVLYGDTPLIRAETLARLAEARRTPVGAAGTDPAVVVLGMRPDDPGAYGRLVLDADGGLARIVEYLDATPEERALDLCNAGLMALDGGRLRAIMERIGNENAKGEYYLTDAVAVARAFGWTCAVVEGATEEALGVNSRAELAALEGLMQDRLRRAAMAAGATLVDPATVWFAADTRLGRDVTVGQNVVFGPGVTVEDGVEILPFCHLTGVTIRRGAIVGPFARMRPGSEIGEGAHIGNFVEVKGSRVGPGAKANHLAYLGDTDVGAKSNIGAGTITCNYDGFLKHRTAIGAGVFVGSNSTLVAPLRIGDGAFIAGGSVITTEVPADALAFGRTRQVVKEAWAVSYRARKQAEKAAKEKAKG
ncbi:bifunctional UDP-N-acetylglucosamine diphosphorylase/glucosamine-1-phosphate N-acetyltransferase GlmU [Rhodospirillum centenum]|uniref:Bifunctional protein GlmU n=1 Tax=Rhodospirillum centenum (strain ATCC 51521 / SW) TaxID=414684 RepID=B6INA0_RHOCS|nr:bifunctional UDP-N-acetylglucosamine diphosphorylase/glucosamine-1-phosphate N-acetyltransferase GlmU [Rhodospirillum centenum]ACI98997.1 UDP-N-acetylglucosamine pyrophosphorylase [Rhodospirillum centenum SW]